MSTTDAFPPPVNPNDLGRGPMVMGLTWALTGLALVTTLLRLYVRKQIAPKLGADDWLMLVAITFQLVAQIFISISFKYGMGKHIWDLDMPDGAVNMTMWEWFSVPPGLVSGIFGRISICFLLIRLFGVHRWFRYYAILLTACGVTLNIAIIVCLYASRQPIQALWDPSIPNPKRWDPNIVRDLMYAGQSLYTLADFTFVIFPIFFVWRLNMSLNRRLGLIVLIALSFITGGISIMKGVLALDEQSGPDGPYAAVLSLLSATLEQACVILLGNIVPLRALLKLDIPKKLSTFFNSLTTLLGQKMQADSNPSTLGGASGYHNGAYRDIEMDGHGLGNKASAVWHEVDDYNLYSSGQVKRTDTFAISYADAGSSNRP
ncbi:uncharacterized protein F4822DRAFT_431003 [Hypoxylon trugodes]|uniref:uncharacterized protein n=1 Tax=Hypoxylon trugodes TaxID=326681 RepID=UPI002199F868|nr:uncharacterized protein F4822DRAFT_431003 [Hypoxylon trugodes]KAI1386130.1 hypothetical protein F4822DRAFT_431003 [Hypoxylon trugodes]